MSDEEEVAGSTAQDRPRFREVAPNQSENVAMRTSSHGRALTRFHLTVDAAPGRPRASVIVERVARAIHPEAIVSSPRTVLFGEMTFQVTLCDETGDALARIADALRAAYRAGEIRYADWDVAPQNDVEGDGGGGTRA